MPDGSFTTTHSPDLGYGGPAGGVVATVADLRRTVALLLEIPDPRIAALAENIDRWLSQPADAPLSFDAVLGFPWGWRAAQQRQHRDAALTRLWRQACPEQAGREAARTIAGLVNRYETTSWPRDHRACRRPDGTNGFIYDVLTLGQIPGEETLRRLFAG